MNPVRRLTSSAKGLLAFACLTIPALAAAQTAHPFRDVPAKYWAYQDMADLQHDGLVTGYQAGYFSGKRLLVRYEFTIAIKRALNRLPLSSEIAQGITGRNLHLGLRDIEFLGQLCDEFAPELESLGTSVPEVKNTLQSLKAAMSSGPAELKLSDGIGGLNLGEENPLLASSAIGGMLPAVTATTGGRAAGNFGPVLAPSAFNSLPGNLLAYPQSMPVRSGLNLHIGLGGASSFALSLERSTEGITSAALPADEETLGTRLDVAVISHVVLGAGAQQSHVESLAPGGPLLNSNIYNVHIGYASGGAKAILGYQYLTSPTGAAGNLALPDLQGPYTRLELRLSHGLQSYVGGAIYRGIGLDSSAPMAGNIYRGRAGIQWSPTSKLRLSASYDGVVYDLNGAISSNGRAPMEQYLTLGAGLSLSRNAVLRMMYRISAQPVSNVVSSPAPSVFSTQLSIHF